MEINSLVPSILGFLGVIGVAYLSYRSNKVMADSKADQKSFDQLKEKFKTCQEDVDKKLELLSKREDEISQLTKANRELMIEILELRRK